MYIMYVLIDLVHYWSMGGWVHCTFKYKNSSTHYFILFFPLYINIHVQVIDGNEDVTCNKGVHAKHCSHIYRHMRLHDTAL